MTESIIYQPNVKLITFLDDKDRILNKACEKVIEITPEIDHLIEDMRATMYYYKGIAIAAPQVGKSLQIIVINSIVFKTEEDTIIINPELEILSDEKIIDMEFCLSFPIGKWVSRYAEVQIKCLDRKMQSVILHGESVKARILQHEIEHLAGITLADKNG